MVESSNFKNYVVKYATENPDLPGQGTNALESIFISYMTRDGRLPLNDEACRDMVLGGMNAYFEIKYNRQRKLDRARMRRENN